MEWVRGVMRCVFNNSFEARGGWFKGNLHAHPTNSDGGRIREPLVELYRSAGYDFFSCRYPHEKFNDR